MRSKKGFALVTVMFIVLILMVMLFGVLSLASYNILFVGNFRQRTAALYAAEAGVAYAINTLEQNPAMATGSFIGSSSNPIKMNKSDGSFYVKIESNDLSGTGKAVILSTGMSGSFKKVVRVEVEREAGSYNAITSEGPIVLSGDVFVNAIKSILYPKEETGNIHTNYSGSLAIDVNGDGVLNINGICSAVGTITDKIPPDHKKEGAPHIQNPGIDKSSLLNVTFTSHTIGADGNVLENTELDGSVVINGGLELHNGVVLHVKGDLTINGGLVGDGTVVVDGKTVIKGATELRTNDAKGIVLYSDGDVVLAHPTVEVVGENTYSVTPSEVAEFFAKMPQLAPVDIVHNLPDDAPRGVEFFRWYADNVQSGGSEEFRLWRDGDGTPINPGLSESVKKWLDSSVPIVDKIVETENVNTSPSPDEGGNTDDNNDGGSGGGSSSEISPVQQR